MPESRQPPIEAGDGSVTRAERRRDQHRRRRIRLAVGALTLALAGAGAGFALSGGSPSAAPAPRPKPAPSTTTTTAPQSGATIATSRVLVLQVRAAPDAAAPVVATFGATTDYGLPTTLLANPNPSGDPAGWVPVSVPLRKPNSSPGWVRASDVAMSTTTYRIEISLSQHTLVLVNGEQPVLTTKVIIGAPTSPTPMGRFFLTDPVNCNTQSVPGYPVGKCSGAYGAFAIGTSALSEALDSFNGTIAQIAIHGTNLPDSELGKDLSNGCVRMPNAVILQIAKIQPLLGTPVTITY